MKKVFIFSLTSFVLLLPVLVFAASNDVQLSSGSTIQVTVSGSVLDFTVSSGNVQSLEVNGANIVATLAAGSTIDITSTDRRSFTYTIGGSAIASFDCGASSSVLNISLPTGGDEVITITPIGVCSTTAGTVTGGGNPYPWYGIETYNAETTGVTTTVVTATTETTSATEATPTTTTVTPSVAAPITPCSN